MAVYANLTVDQGSQFVSTITVEDGSGLPYPLTGFTARGMIRRTYTSTTAYNISCVISRPSEGEIDITLSSTLTGNMKAGRYMYDIEIVNSTTGEITRVVEGQVEVTPRITR